MSVTRIRSGAEIFPPDSKRPQDSLYYYPEEFCFLAQIVREGHRKSRKPSRLRPWPSSIFYLPSSRLRRQPRWVHSWFGDSSSSALEPRGLIVFGKPGDSLAQSFAQGSATLEAEQLFHARDVEALFHLPIRFRRVPHHPALEADQF